MLLGGLGWRMGGHFPDRPKFIIAVAPHSSNIDFVLTMGVIMSLGLRCSFLAKASLFRFPLGLLMRAFGGIPVDRSSKNGVVEQMSGHFQRAEQLILGITPEGTRSAVNRWRSGFALIAKEADVPVQPAVVNYREKTITFSPLIEDVSDAEATVKAVQSAASLGSPRNTG
ncbi:MAG: 1-acyl-sn-glycerol-3-phosphate acyltransferase [Xanthomonadales bacterium]|nr:1-acyl-sn-glycerol-3-phosphate acyltransferase [Xanthomonadales bacterium]